MSRILPMLQQSRSNAFVIASKSMPVFSGNNPENTGTHKVTSLQLFISSMMPAVECSGF